MENTAATISFEAKCNNPAHTVDELGNQKIKAALCTINTRPRSASLFNVVLKFSAQKLFTGVTFPIKKPQITELDFSFVKRNSLDRVRKSSVHPAEPSAASKEVVVFFVFLSAV